jgi:hypothetical protein
MTEATFKELGDGVGFQLLPQGYTRFRHIAEPVSVYSAVRPSGATHLEIDPVCRMAVDP